MNIYGSVYLDVDIVVCAEVIMGDDVRVEIDSGVEVGNGDTRGVRLEVV